MIHQITVLVINLVCLQKLENPFFLGQKKKKKKLFLKNFFKKLKININNLSFYFNRKVDMKITIYLTIKYLKKTNSIFIEFIFKYLYIFENFYNLYYIKKIKYDKKFEEKVETFKPDLEITKFIFNFTVNPSWLQIFIINLELSVFSFITKIDFDFIFGHIFAYFSDLYVYIYFDIERYVELWTEYLETHDLSGLKDRSRYYIEDMFTMNNISFLKNIHNEFSTYSSCFDFEYINLRILIFDFIIVPYHFLEEWFVVQLESWIILGRIIAVIHYSDQKIKTAYGSRIVDNYGNLWISLKRSLWAQEIRV